MIRIHYDEATSEFEFRVDAGEENGGMTLSDLVIHMMEIVGGMAGFLRDEFGRNAMDAFMNAISELDRSGLLGVIAEKEDEDAE